MLQPAGGAALLRYIAVPPHGAIKTCSAILSVDTIKGAASWQTTNSVHGLPSVNRRK